MEKDTIVFEKRRTGTTIKRILPRGRRHLYRSVPFAFLFCAWPGCSAGPTSWQIKGIIGKEEEREEKRRCEKNKEIKEDVCTFLAAPVVDPDRTPFGSMTRSRFVIDLFSF